jgi:undecaprenyl-diphosphatase
VRDERTIEVRAAAAGTVAIALLIPAALIAVLVVADVGWLHRFDVHVTASGHALALRHAGLVRFMEIWSLVFAPASWRAAALLLVVWLARRRAWAPAVLVAVTMTAGGLLGVVLKLLVGRHRPDLLDPVARASGWSFPSGHALNSALAASVFLLVLLPVAGRARAALRAAAIVIPLITGLARIGLGVHWTSDVVAGWLLGVAVTAATTWACLSRPGRSKPTTWPALRASLARRSRAARSKPSGTP